MAAPIAAGLSALVRAAFPTLRQTKVIDHIVRTSTRVDGPIQARINAGAALLTSPEDDNPTPTLQFSAASISGSEGAGRINVVVTRAGDATTAVSVDYSTRDSAGLNNCNAVTGIASSRCDYATYVGTLRFAPGEISRPISIPVVNDAYVEGNESFTLELSNPNGAGLGALHTATLTILDNDTTQPATNPIDGTNFFVRQHYIDFLGREPDPLAAGWVNQINQCVPVQPSCDRLSVSQGIYLSPEFRDRGFFIYKFFAAALARKPSYAEFVVDRARVSGFQSDTQLEQSKRDFIADFMTRTDFVATYGGLTNNAFVQRLFAKAGLTEVTVNGVVQTVATMQQAMATGKTRAQVLRDVAESPEANARFINEATIVMHYFGYLRRDPDAFYQDWIRILTETGDSRNVTNGFVNSSEYRMRFGK
jgi:hypothetical protein